MAIISQILPRRWPGRQWIITGDDYATLVWGILDDGQVVNTNPEPKPTEAEIRAFSDDVDLELADEAKEQSREEALLERTGKLFEALDIISDYLTGLHQELPANVRSQIPAAVVTRAQALRNKLNQVLAQFPDP